MSKILPAAGLCQRQVLFYRESSIKLTKTLTFTTTVSYDKVVIKFTFSKANSSVWFDVVSLKK